MGMRARLSAHELEQVWELMDDDGDGMISFVRFPRRIMHTPHYTVVYSQL